MRLLRAIWAVYGIALFLLMMLVSIPYLLVNMVFLPEKKAIRRSIWYLHHVFTTVFFALIGVRIKVIGREKVDRIQSYVLVGNHQTALDFVANGYAFPGVFRFLAKQELQKIPIFGFVVKKMCLVVDRKSMSSRSQSLVALKKELEEGVSVFIYPEGTRNKSQEPLGHFYDGAFRLALQTRATILPMVILNAPNVCQPGQLDLWPGTLKIAFGDPIPTADLPDESAGTLKEQVRSAMLQLLQLP